MDRIEVDRSKGIQVSRPCTVRVNHKAGLVYMLVDDKLLEMRTPAAHKVGFALCKQGGEARDSETIVVKINGEAVQFEPRTAKLVGAALLRKADSADDFQRGLT